jgi:hypothetical protein
MRNYTDYQDLDSSEVEYSYKHPTLFTITVTSPRMNAQATTPSPAQDVSQWHLPATSETQHSPGRFMYKLHTVDMYFWTSEDAGLFLDSLKRVLAPGQLRILDANNTHPEHRDSMSPVVQQLEKVAISPQPQAPAVHRTESNTTANSVPIVSPLSHTSSTPGMPSPPPPPPATQSIEQNPAAYAPMAYNPAAPAAPEPIAHREKTPPPPDAESGTGLVQAAVHEQPPAISSAPSFGPQAGAPFNPLQQQFAPVPTNAPAYGQAPTMGIPRSNTIGYGYAQPHIQQPLTPSSMHGMPGPPSAPSPFEQHQYAQQPTPGLIRHGTMPVTAAAPPYSPGPYVTSYAQQPSGTPPIGATGLPSPGIYSGHQAGYIPGAPQYTHAASPYQVGGAAQYGVSHTLHQQLYIPESGTKNDHPVQAGPGQSSATGGLEQRLRAVDKGMSGTFKGFIKKLDKKM